MRRIFFLNFFAFLLAADILHFTFDEKLAQPEDDGPFVALGFIDLINRGSLDKFKKLLTDETFLNSIGKTSLLPEQTIFVKFTTTACLRHFLDNAFADVLTNFSLIEKAKKTARINFYSSIIINNCDLSCSVFSQISRFQSSTTLLATFCQPEVTTTNDKTTNNVIFNARETLLNALIVLKLTCLTIVAEPKSESEKIVSSLVRYFRSTFNECVIREYFDYRYGVRPTTLTDSFSKGPTAYLLYMSDDETRRYHDHVINEKFASKKLAIIMNHKVNPRISSTYSRFNKLKRALFMTYGNAGGLDASKSLMRPVQSSSLENEVSEQHYRSTFNERMLDSFKTFITRTKEKMNNWEADTRNDNQPEGVSSSINLWMMLRDDNNEAHWFRYGNYHADNNLQFVDDSNERETFQSLWSLYPNHRVDPCGLNGDNCKIHPFARDEVFSLIMAVLMPLTLLIVGYSFYFLIYYQRLRESVRHWKIPCSEESKQIEETVQKPRNVNMENFNLTRLEETFHYKRFNSTDVRKQTASFKSSAIILKASDTENTKTDDGSGTVNLSSSGNDEAAVVNNKNNNNKNVSERHVLYSSPSKTSHYTPNPKSARSFASWLHIEADHRTNIQKKISISGAFVDKPLIRRYVFFQEDEVFLNQLNASQAWDRCIDIKLLEELDQMKNLNHENLLPFLGICFKRRSVLMLAAKRGSLRDIIRDKCLNQIFNLGLIASLLLDIAKGMDYLHNSKIRSHGHLRSTKCVVDSRWNCKISGYGLSILRKQQKMSDQTKLHNMLYAPPELLRIPINYRSYYGTRKGDVYSFSIILQEVILMDQPYAIEINHKNLAIERILAMVRSRQKIIPFRPSLGESCKTEWKMLVQACWSEAPEKRFSFQQIVTILRNLAGAENLTFVERLGQRLEQNVANLGNMVSELTADVQTESEKSVALLSCLLPKRVAEDYVLGKTYEPEVFRSVTLLCTDLIGFTRIASLCTPIQTVEFLNSLYSIYDDIIKQKDAYKLETVGDAYIVISGCPERNEDLHASEIANVALALFEALQSFKIPHLPDEVVQSRAGIHSGPIIAGVVGLKVPRFCVFGRTFNTAEIIESTSSANRIHITLDSVKLLPEEEFWLENRGKIRLSDNLFMQTFFLTGKRMLF